MSSAINYHLLIMSTAISFGLQLLADTQAIDSRLRDPISVPESMRPTHFDKALEATGIFEDHCSGTYISNHGHILTALHCIPFLNSQLQIPELKVVVNLADAKLKLKKMRYYFGMHGNLDVSGATGQIIIMGKGYYRSINHYDSNKLNHEEYIKLMAEGYGPPEDFVIVKIDRENTPCFKIKPTVLTPGTPIWSIGYPDHVKSIQNRPNWKNIRQGFTAGVVTRGVADNQIIQNAIMNLGQSEQAYWLDFLKPMDRAGQISSTLDALSGSSGAGIFDNDGYLVGLINATESFQSSVEEQYHSGITHGASATTIMQRAKEELSAEAFEQVFDCQN